MRRTLGSLIAMLLLGMAAPAAAITIDLTLDVDRVSSPGQVIFTVGLAEAGTGDPLSINGYTLGIEWDAVELGFVSAEQLVSFGALGVTSFLGANDCSNGSCTAGNVPTEDSLTVGAMFAVIFDVLMVIDDGLVDFRAGILDSATDDVTQPTGEPVFDKGVSVVSSAPEPGGLALFVVAAALLACQRRFSLIDKR